MPPNDTAPDAQLGRPPEPYVPEPGRRRTGIGLSLSGGGYRATLYHLGSLRRLHELGVLRQIHEVSSVSGGSITNAFLARAVREAERAGRAPLADFERELAAPVRAFTARNIRTGAILKRLLPWNWLRDDTSARALADAYRKALPDFACAALPELPQFVFCSTDMTFGVNWTFTRARIGDYQAGSMAPTAEHDVALAVAASSCFPPVFNPLRMHLDPATLRRGSYRGADRDELVRGIRLTDGGNYDNLGLEPIWKDRAIVLVSDGGGPFDYSTDQGLFWRVSRYSDMLYRQVTSLRKRWLIASFITGVLDGTYWGAGSDVTHYTPDAVGYPGDFSYEVLARIRTDLDAFSEAEASALENHGYALAEAAITRHAPRLIQEEAPFRPPHPRWDWTRLDELRRALRDSGKRKILGRRSRRALDGGAHRA